MPSWHPLALNDGLVVVLLGCGMLVDRVVDHRDPEEESPAVHG